MESTPLKIERNNKMSNEIDAEFDMLESVSSLEERMGFIREMFDEVFDPPLSRERLPKIREQGRGRIKHFFLPGIPGGEGDIKKIREGYDQRSEYLKSDNRIFLKVGQGEMWVIPKAEKPYFKVSMSECSAIVGTDDEKLVIAHISYSAVNEIEATLEFMKNTGISLENIHVVASTGKFQKMRSDDENGKRAFESSVYTSLGIPESNISQFEFAPGEAEKDGGWLSRNLTQVIGTSDALLKNSFDLRNTSRSAAGSSREEKSGDYKDEEIIEI